MKKIYAFLAAALMSVSMFAATPTAANLASYAKEGHYVVCFSTPANATCNDIYWAGSYNGWTIDLPLEDMVLCEKLTGFDGWYVAVVPVAPENGENSGKPIQLSECGKLSWSYQCGKYGTIELVSGSVDIVSAMSGAETDLKNWSTTEPTIITMTEWKDNPCTKICSEQAYTIQLFDPYCESHPEFAPTLMGSFNNWGTPATMTLKNDPELGSYYEYVTQPVTSDLQFKFNNDVNGSWDNQFERYNAEGDTWEAFENFNLTDETYYTRTGYTLVFDFWDVTKYRYAQCSAEPEDTTAYQVAVSLTAPAGAPAAGIDIIGDFDGWTGSVMTLANGVYTATVSATASQKFKFREAGTWDNEIMVADAEAEGGWKGFPDTQFQSVWQPAAEEGKMVITLDLSDPAMYAWKVPYNEGIEEVVLTEQAQKVIVDGVLYIVRDNKMFNVQGTQVR